MITPIEIRKKEFEKAFRGYDKEEVDNFLQNLSQEWEKLLEENRELQKKNKVYEAEISRLREVETTLLKTMKSAEETSMQIIEQANKSAELYTREAQMNAEIILNEARAKAKAIIEDAEIEVKNIVDDLQAEIKQIEKEYYFIDEQKNNLIEEIKSLIRETADKTEKYLQKSNRNVFEEKIKEIRKLNVPSPVKNLEITNSASVMEQATTEAHKEPHTHKAKQENEKSFFDSIE
ncbi:MAG: DivIVA domain-containing protein [Cytophagaceae bacterium]|nr:DivIVA domain-containing protein [Cytophagaceae bacterium]MDW8455486.1 DivIVA domain-containing protein [Cytophagaceae bacterium]